MIRTVPQWHHKSHCAVDICVSSLSCSNEKLTTDRLQRKQSTCAQYIVHLFYSPFPERRTEKKVTAIKNGKPTMTDQHL